MRGFIGAFALCLLVSQAPVSANKFAKQFGNKIVTLKSHHGNYLVCEPNGNVAAYSYGVGPFERFRVELVSGDKIALKNVGSNKYLVAESNGDFKCDRPGIGPWEKFNLEKHSNRIFGLKTHHGKYVKAEKDERVNARGDWFGPWERFNIHFGPVIGRENSEFAKELNGDMINLISHHKKIRCGRARRQRKCKQGPRWTF